MKKRTKKYREVFKGLTFFSFFMIAVLALVNGCTRNITVTPSTPPSSSTGPANTNTPTATFTPANTNTPTATFTPANTDTPTATFTPAITDTPTVTDTATVTPTPTATKTPTVTPTPTVGETLWFDNQVFSWAGPDACSGSGPTSFVYNDFEYSYSGFVGWNNNGSIGPSGSANYWWQGTPPNNPAFDGVTAKNYFMDNVIAQAPSTVSFALKLVFDGKSGSGPGCPACTPPYYAQIGFYTTYLTSSCPMNSFNSSVCGQDLYTYFNNTAPQTLTFWMQSDQAPVSFLVGLNTSCDTAGFGCANGSGICVQSLYQTPLTITSSLTWQQFTVPLTSAGWDANFTSLDWTDINNLVYQIYE